MAFQFQSIQIFQTPHWITLLGIAKKDNDQRVPHQYQHNFAEEEDRDSLTRVDPLNHLMRCQLIVRRVYRVPGANSLWHIDGNHKLIKWRFIIHGGIDGFSRLIVYLHCSTNNRSATVMTLFHEAAEKYGVPSRVRSDMGGENILVCHYMVLVRGIGRGSHLAGSSTRNQRIETLWSGVSFIQWKPQVSSILTMRLTYCFCTAYTFHASTILWKNLPRPEINTHYELPIIGHHMWHSRRKSTYWR